MIATITLNPAIDKTLEVSQLNLGAVNRMDSVKNIAGGKGINVTKVLRQYGYEVKALGFLGNKSGQIINDCLKNISAIDMFTAVEGDVRTSTNIVSDNGMVTELLEPGPVILDEDRLRFLNDFEKNIADCEYIVISGSAPKGMSSDIYADMIKIAKSYDIKVVLDASGDNLKSGIKAKPYMIKPNLKELEQLLGRRFGDNRLETVSEAIVELIKGGIPNVMVSMGADGIIYGRLNEMVDAKQPEEARRGCVHRSITIVKVAAPKLEVVNSVGSGDSAVAAFVMADSNKMNIENMAKRCVAISAANVLTIENGVIDIKAANEIEKNLRVDGCVNIDL